LNDQVERSENFSRHQTDISATIVKIVIERTISKDMTNRPSAFETRDPGSEKMVVIQSRSEDVIERQSDVPMATLLRQSHNCRHVRRELIDERLGHHS
jgi:hypothetical protein